MKIIVPDASVLLKWILPVGEEPDVNHALRLQQAAVDRRITLKVPTLWLYEVGNTLSRQFPEQTRELLEALIAFDLEEGDSSIKWLNHAVLLTKRYGVTFYDASYHALALVEKGTFVTADNKYVKKAGEAGSVISLEEWR